MGIFWNVPVQVFQDEKCSIRISPVVSMCSNGRNIWMAKCFILQNMINSTIFTSS
nr:hypothetical protein Iba_chr07bCG11620 [Ipomoea batatas]GMD16559.1 hypothetical protein Iba_chr07cCG10590 [Ipomoea batatas]GMD18035.1 hypothetical protein Iba_chr07dCG9390 [Ipomoea batatas]GMD20763.1 hypothetical protein Iba_chr07fCG7790 [Ipomoea batatas]